MLSFRYDSIANFQPTLSELTVRKRPPYNYQDLAELLRSLQ
jgi:hypothetical protein